MFPPTTRSRSVATALLAVGAGLVALDVTTSLIPSFIDAQMQPLPPRGGPGWWVEVGIAALAGAWALRAAPRWARAWRALPIPAGAKIASTLFVLVTAAHVALRTENYPFSNVGMFSQAVPERVSRMTYEARYGVVVPTPRGPRPVNFLREASGLWSRYGLDLDAKAGWLLRFYAAKHPRAFEWVRRVFRAEGLPPPRRCKIVFHRGSGRLHRVRCAKREGSG